VTLGLCLTDCTCDCRGKGAGRVLAGAGSGCADDSADDAVGTLPTAGRGGRAAPGKIELYLSGPFLVYLWYVSESGILLIYWLPGAHLSSTLALL